MRARTDQPEPPNRPPSSFDRCVGEQRAGATEFAGTVYRQCDPRHPLISSPPQPSMFHRWRGALDSPRICATLHPVTPWLELERAFGPDVRVAEIRARLYGSIGCALTAVLDLRDPDVRFAVRVTRTMLTGDDVEVTRAIASAAEHHGFDAILTPSAVSRSDATLVVLPAGIGSIWEIDSSIVAAYEQSPEGAAG